MRVINNNIVCAEYFQNWMQPAQKRIAAPDLVFLYDGRFYSVFRRRKVAGLLGEYFKQYLNASKRTVWSSIIETSVEFRR